jgi:hypothetical protein
VVRNYANQNEMKTFTTTTRKQLASTLATRWQHARDLGVDRSSHLFGIDANGLMEGYRVDDSNGQRRIVFAVGRLDNEAKRVAELKEGFIPTRHDGTSDLTSAVKYVPDDQVTALVELSRRLFVYDELCRRLGAIVRDAVAMALDNHHSD